MTIKNEFVLRFRGVGSTPWFNLPAGEFSSSTLYRPAH